jgi:hypothetical protein
MALSMEEQRILAEIEQHLTRAEPALAARFARMGHPHPSIAGALKSPRGRLVVSLAAIVTLVITSMLVYLMVSLRGMPQRSVGGRPAAATATPQCCRGGAASAARRSPPRHRAVVGPAPQGRGSAPPARPAAKL